VSNKKADRSTDKTVGKSTGKRAGKKAGKPAGATLGARCPWAESSDAMRAYHDAEWGVPSHDERHLFEFLVLEGAQAGLSWSTILAKRDNYRVAFAGFDPALVAAFGEAKLNMLLEDPGIVRNRLKVHGAARNARAFLAVQEEYGSFGAYLWSWVDGTPVVTRRRPDQSLPATTELSDRLSRDLKRRDFTFVGSTIVYSYLQSVGLVDDHVAGCPAARSS
jgi:DNA-3-methyladenine glycosylase I